MTTVAILGATSHIAKGLIVRFLASGDVRLNLYARSAESVNAFLATVGAKPGDRCVVHEGYDVFPVEPCQTIINCVGVRAVGKAKVDFTSYFTVTEHFDNMVVNYLREKSPETLYINFSSGAVYGRSFSAPVDDHSKFSLNVNTIEPEDYYGIARIHSEAKHRAFGELRIVDLRIFSYFSRYLDLDNGYFLADVLHAILEKRVLITDDANMVRDYLHPDDLFAMVRLCMGLGRVNRPFNVRSGAPVTKDELLAYFATEYGLRYERRPRLANPSATGSKEHYYSVCDMACDIGYHPQFSSLDTIRQETRHFSIHRVSSAGQE